MIDIHTHILPAEDDGVETLSEALALIKVESAAGTTDIVSTSHILEVRDIDRLVARQEKLLALQAHLDEEQIPVRLHFGSEVFPIPAALKAIDRGSPLTLAGGSYVLVDLPLSQFPEDLSWFLFELQSRGLRPILAHPERTLPVQRDPSILQPMIERGIAVQVNAGSVLGQYGPACEDMAWNILGWGWANLLASDLHRPSREGKLRRAATAIAGEVSPAYSHYLCTDSPGCVLRPEPLPTKPDIPQPQAKRSRWNWFRKR